MSSYKQYPAELMIRSSDVDYAPRLMALSTDVDLLRGSLLLKVVLPAVPAIEVCDDIWKRFAHDRSRLHSSAVGRLEFREFDRPSHSLLHTHEKDTSRLCVTQPASKTTSWCPTDQTTARSTRRGYRTACCAAIAQSGAKRKHCAAAAAAAT